MRTTPLSQAIKRGKSKIVKLLLEAKAELNVEKFEKVNRFFFVWAALRCMEGTLQQFLIILNAQYTVMVSCLSFVVFETCRSTKCDI